MFFIDDAKADYFYNFTVSITSPFTGHHGMSKLYIKQTGNKEFPCVIFLHAIATNGWMWEEIEENMRDFHCIIPDLPGHGKSAKVNWISVSDTAETIADIIRNHSINSKAHIVGLSLGSYIGMELISKHPDCVESAVLSGLNIWTLPNKWMMNSLGLFILPFLKSDFIIRHNARMLKIPAIHYEGYKKSFLQVNKRSFWNISNALGNFSIPTNIATTQCRTLLIAGEQEHRLIVKSLKTLKDFMPGASAFKVPNVGHAWSAENPQLFTETIRSWILGKALPAVLQQVV